MLIITINKLLTYRLLCVFWMKASQRLLHKEGLLLKRLLWLCNCVAFMAPQHMDMYDMRMIKVCRPPQCALCL